MQTAVRRLTEEKLEMNRELTEQRNTIDDLNKSRDESIKRGRRTANAITSTTRRVKPTQKEHLSVRFLYTTTLLLQPTPLVKGLKQCMKLVW